MGVTLHLIKLCVGATGPDSLAAWQESLVTRGAPTPYHITRMFPRRADEILSGGGSLFWVINGHCAVRQRIVGIEKTVGADGIERCRLNFDSALIAVDPVPRRPFQGWRYLTATDAPADLTAGGAGDPAMARELARLGLL